MVEILAEFDKSMELSGYTKYRRQEIMKAGLLGYKRKAIRCIEKTGFSRHIPGVDGQHARRLRKMADKLRWFKKKPKGDFDEKATSFETERDDVEINNWRRSGGEFDERERSQKSTTTMENKDRSDPIAVLFVQRTVGGNLLREMRKREETIRKSTGNNIRLVERAGTPLEQILVKKDPWSKYRCPGINCFVCLSEGKSICMKKGIIYMHECALCKQEGKTAVYYGQSSRTLLERASEHNKAYLAKSKKSHAWWHIEECHEDEAKQELPSLAWWKWSLKEAPISCFSRVVGEAVYIKLSMANKSEKNLNGREEFGFYELPQISINGKTIGNVEDKDELNTAEPRSELMDNAELDLNRALNNSKRRSRDEDRKSVPVLSSDVKAVSVSNKRLKLQLPEVRNSRYTSITDLEEKILSKSEFRPELRSKAETIVGAKSKLKQLSISKMFSKARVGPNLVPELSSGKINAECLS